MNTWKPPIASEITETHTYDATGVAGSVTYRTEGLRGGDAGHGAYLEVAFETSNCSTTLSATVEAPGYGAVVLDDVANVSLTFQGDSEILAAVECFEFLADKLRAVFPEDDAVADAHAPTRDMRYSANIITEERGGQQSNLRCPRCGGSYLHQGAVIIWDRSEDQRIERQTVAGSGAPKCARVEAASSGNPSARRQGLAIQFECEGCSEGSLDRIELVIAQHKGETEIGWRYLPAKDGAL